MRYETISEGATLVHEIDLAARKHLLLDFEKYLKPIWKRFNPMGYQEDNPDQHRDDYETMYEFYRQDENASTLFRELMEVASKTLTRLIHDDLTSRYGPSVMLKIDGIKTAKISVVTMQVELAEQPTEGRDARVGGFFSPGLSWSWIRVNVRKETIISAAMAVIQTMAFGESEEREALVDSVVPTFIHEYSHLLQYLGGGNEAFQPGITTVGGGKRGNRFSGSGDSPTMIEWWRYKGSYAELDSFASDAASMMVASIYSYGERPDNSQITDRQRDVASGYAPGGTYRHYLELYQDALRDHYEEIGLDKREAQQTWNRFLKLLFAKLEAYKRAVHGKDTSGWHTSNAPKEWVEWAGKGMSYCAARLADEVAKKCADHSYKSFDDTWRIEPYEEITRAENFLQAYFFDEYAEFEKTMKISRAFKNLVARRIPLYQKDLAA